MMHFLQFIMYLLIALLLSATLSISKNIGPRFGVNDIVHYIRVDQSGKGDFVTVQQAIDSIPSNNTEWTLVRINKGIYTEKVTLPRDKPYIMLEGDSSSNTVIQFGSFGSAATSSTINFKPPYIVAANITFKNTYNVLMDPYKNGGKQVTWAPAASIGGDKSYFYRCGFIGLQDTLTDYLGRHVFDSCYIQGAIDFIWGYGRSLYTRCVINVTGALLPKGFVGFITANGRNKTDGDSVFVFEYCNVKGTGQAYLGRAWGKYSRVIFIRSAFSDVISPAGWNQWHYNGPDGLINYTEENNKGAGSDKSKRVKWMKKLSLEEIYYYENTTSFINWDRWIQELPATLHLNTLG